MKIIIVGLGKVGAMMASQLNAEGHEISVVDEKENLVREVSSNLDILGVTGNGLMLDVLEKAGIGGADLLIATTTSDEVNMLCCLLAKKEGHCKTIARIRSFEYDKEIDYLKKAMNLSLVMNPEKSCAREIFRLTKFPTALQIETFAGGRIEMIQTEVSDTSKIVGVSLKDLPKVVSSPVLISLIERDGQSFVPHGDTTIEKGDKISFIAKYSDAMHFTKECNPDLTECRSIFLIGGGMVAQNLALILQANHRLSDLKVIELNPATCNQFATRFPEATVICGDGSDKNLLKEEGVMNADIVVSLTGMDEQNLMTGLLLKDITNARSIAKVDHFELSDVPPELSVGSVVCPKISAVNSVVRFVRGLENGGENIESLYRIGKGAIEVLEFRIDNESGIINIPIFELSIKKNILIGAILRNRTVLQPKGSDTLQPNDTIIVIADSKTGIRSVKDIVE